MGKKERLEKIRKSPIFLLVLSKKGRRKGKQKQSTSNKKGSLDLAQGKHK
jgi:hypothetical protein